MAKGQTNQPLVIRVLDQDLFETKEVQDLIEKGHTVENVVMVGDLVIGRQAHYMSPDLLKHLDTAIKGVRAKKYPKKKKEKK